MKNLSYFLLAALALFAAPVFTLAAPPKPTGLFPLGVQRGQSVTITVTGAMKPWPAQVQVSGAGVTLAPEKEEGRFKLSAAADAEPGLRLVRFFNDEGASAPLPIVVGTLPEIEEKEPNNETTAAHSISPVAAVVNGRLAKAGDIDTFSVTLTGGQTLVADVAAERLGSPMDGVLQILSAEGFVLAQNHDTRGQDPRLVFTAPRDGSYLVRLFAFPATATGSVAYAGGDKFAYRLTLTTGGYLNYTLPLAIERGVETRLELVGWNIPEALRSKQITPASDATSVVIYDAQLAGEVRVDVVGKKCLVEAEPNGTAPNDLDHAQAIAWPAVVSGQIDAPGDLDVFAIEAKKGQNLALVVRSQRLGFPLDGELRVYDSQKKLLTSRDDSGKERDPELNYTIPADGKYLIAVADLYGDGSADHAYTLDINLVEPDYNLAFATSELTTAAKKEIDLPITIDRANGFAEEIEVTVAGLPEGAKCEPVRSAAKGDSAKKITLKIAPGEKPFRGPIQITARSLGSAARQRTAKMPLAGLGASIDNVWLTVTGK